MLKLIAFSKSYFHSARNVFELMLSICSFGYIIFAVVTLSIDVKKELYSPLSDVALSLAVMRCLTLLGKYVSWFSAWSGGCLQCMVWWLYSVHGLVVVFSVWSGGCLQCMVWWLSSVYGLVVVFSVWSSDCLQCMVWWLSSVYGLVVVFSAWSGGCLQCMV